MLGCGDADAMRADEAGAAARLTSTLIATRTEIRSHPFVALIGAVTVCCVLLGAAAIGAGQLRGENRALAVFTIVAGISFIVAGLAASSRRPEKSTGILMVGSGFALFAGALIQANQSLPFTIGLAVILIPTAVLPHLLLAFPDGHLHSKWERIFVASAYFNAIVVQISMLMFMDIDQVGGCPCPHNLLFIRDNMAVHSALMNIEWFAMLLVATAVVVILVRRWRHASVPLRRALLPVLVSGGVATVLFAAMLVDGALPYQGVPISLQAAQRVAYGVVPLAYLLGLFRARLARVGVSDLIVELGNGLEPGQLREALARALRDPSLELGYWMPDSGEYVDVDGRPIIVKPANGRSVTILARHGRRVAALVYDAGLDEDPPLLNAVSSAAGLALENERLLAELRVQLEEIRHSRARIVDAADSERRRLERNLHDGAQQGLVTLALHLRIAQESLHDDPSAAEEMLDGVGEDLKLALGELRDLARGLHPAILTDRGLAPALQSLANRAPFRVEITGIPTVRPNAAVEAAIYYVVAESLTNAAKHARATDARVALSTADSIITVEIRDNGTGGATLSGGSGLRGLADRVEALNGTIEVQSPAGAGTLIRAKLPRA
jgi:signal transduction histidine kinase